MVHAGTHFRLSLGTAELLAHKAVSATGLEREPGAEVVRKEVVAAGCCGVEPSATQQAPAHTHSCCSTVGHD